MLYVVLVYSPKACRDYMVRMSVLMQINGLHPAYLYFALQTYLLCNTRLKCPVKNYCSKLMAYLQSKYYFIVLC